MFNYDWNSIVWLMCTICKSIAVLLPPSSSDLPLLPRRFATCTQSANIKWKWKNTTYCPLQQMREVVEDTNLPHDQDNIPCHRGEAWEVTVLGSNPKLGHKVIHMLMGPMENEQCKTWPKYMHLINQLPTDKWTSLRSSFPALAMIEAMMFWMAQVMSWKNGMMM